MTSALFRQAHHFLTCLQREMAWHIAQDLVHNDSVSIVQAVSDRSLTSLSSAVRLLTETVHVLRRRVGPRSSLSRRAGITGAGSLKLWA